ncbi:MAG: TolC family protein [Opitutus sp.]|nr:TolC family protein [Opitutus sp.]MCS6248559.1 TolC family protein [Opitutus sp.]MCS6275316.1 TolC family protein [Opitutus sp.]MCS6277497.1 TolC family protein [Opitutus sp.]MCS6300615.1 TolC family protein [Opitutus sp.]
MHYPRRLLGLALLSLGSLSAAPIQYPEAEIPELNSLLEKARENAPALVAQSLAQKESVARLEAAEGKYYPRVDVGFNSGITKTMYMTGDTPAKQNMGLGFNASITRPLYNWGALDAAIEQARLDFKNEELQRVFILRQMKRTLRADYLTLLVNQESLVTLRLRRQQIQDGITRTQTDKEQGTASDIAIEQANLDLSQSLVDIDLVEAQQRRILVNFKLNLGWDAPLALNVPVPNPDAAAVIAWADQNQSLRDDAWLQDSSEVMRRQNFVARERLELIKVKAAQRPNFNFTAATWQSQTNTSSADSVQTLSYFVGVSMAWNVFDGSSNSAKKREVLLRQRRLDAQLVAFRDELRLQCATVVAMIGFSARQLQIDQRRAELATQKFAVQERDAKEGRISQQELRSKQVVHNEAQQTVSRTRVRLLLAINDYLDLTLPAAVNL